MMDTVASPSSSLIKTIYSKIQTITKSIENRPQPIEIKHEWTYASNGEICPYYARLPVQEHCIGLCRSPSYRKGRENMLYISLNYLPLDWKSVRQTMLKTREVPTTYDSEVKYRFMRNLQSVEIENGEGAKMVNMWNFRGHAMMRVTTILPVDENFVVHGYSKEKPSSQQSRCWHMSAQLERDYDELIQKVRKPIIYSMVNSPDCYYDTGFRQCNLCPSEYWTLILRTEEWERYHGKKYPYRLHLLRWIDLGEYNAQEESQEFKALTAGQVCCDHSTRAKRPPIACLWYGRDWSTMPSMYEQEEILRKEVKLKEKRWKEWYRFWKWGTRNQ